VGEGGIVQSITAVVDGLGALRTWLDLLHGLASYSGSLCEAPLSSKGQARTGNSLLTVTKWRWSSLGSALTTSTAQSMSVSGLGCQQP
jgi:hypothetical protein